MHMVVESHDMASETDVGFPVVEGRHGGNILGLEVKSSFGRRRRASVPAPSGNQKIMPRYANARVAAADAGTPRDTKTRL